MLKLFSYTPILFELFKTDFKIFRQTILDKCINVCIWVICTGAVFTFLLPAFGLEASYGAFMIAGLIATAGNFEVFPSVMHLVSDFEGDRIVSFYATLPMPTFLVFIRFFVYYAFNAMTMCTLVLPVCKLVFWSSFDLDKVSIPKFMLAFLLVNTFYGAYTVWIASRVSTTQKIGNVWMRFVFPLWFLGAFQFSWMVLYDIFPVGAYLDLLNPMVYVQEIMRSALLGSEGYLPFLASACMLTFFIVFFLSWGIMRLKKRLDFV
jgi:ABC-type polysaccharide/polyol phosphate export permease